MLTFQTINAMPLNQANATSNQILNAVANGKLAKNLILFGDNGSGKSTLARHLPIWFQAARGEPDGVIYKHMDVPNDLDTHALQTMCRLASINLTGLDWIVLDEADKSSDKTFLGKLHGILELNSQKVFILTANTLAAFPRGILSRCIAVQVVAPTPAEYLPYAQSVLAGRGISKTNSSVLSLLQSAAIGGNDCRKYELALAMI